MYSPIVIQFHKDIEVVNTFSNIQTKLYLPRKYYIMSSGQTAIYGLLPVHWVCKTVKIRMRSMSNGEKAKDAEVLKT